MATQNWLWKKTRLGKSSYEEFDNNVTCMADNSLKSCLCKLSHIQTVKKDNLTEYNKNASVIQI